MPKSVLMFGLSFDVKEPYAEGHVLTANEAAVLNQTRAENVGNGIRAKIKEEMEAAGVKLASDLPAEKQAELIADFAKFDSEYVFGERRARETDPVKAEAIRIGREVITNALINQKGYVKKDITKEVLDPIFDRFWASHGETWTKQAEKIVRERQKAVTLDLSDLT